MVPEESPADGVDPDDADPADTDPADDRPTWPKAAPFSPTAAFEDPYRIKPSRHQPAFGQIPPSVPQDPILPYIAPPVPRHRRSDWPVVVVAMIISALVMAGCCIAGFALYSGYGGTLFN
jgi:hypothetical protein